MAKSLNVLVTGGAGFIGRWVVKLLLDNTPHRVAVVDDLSNGSRDNIEEFKNEPRFAAFEKTGIENNKRMAALFEKFQPGLCLHLAAQIIVQESIDDPAKTFRADVEGTFRLLELCRARRCGMLFMSTCMVYDLAAETGAISEAHPTVPRSPYAGAKLAGEHLCLSYAHAYGLPVTVIRPFNTYGPHQKSSGEGGVVSIFLSRALRGESLNIYGRIFNAGTGSDVDINTLAQLCIDCVPGTKSKIKHVKHIHPQSEIMKLRCNPSLVRKTLGWKPSVKLERGLTLTRDWIVDTQQQGRASWS